VRMNPVPSPRCRRPTIAKATGVGRAAKSPIVGRARKAPRESASPTVQDHLFDGELLLSLRVFQMQLECWLKKKRDAHFLLLSETFFFFWGGGKGGGNSESTMDREVHVS